MDGSGTLLETQLDSLGPCFDIRCLAIAPNDDTGWTRLARQVVRLIREELNRTAAAENAVRKGKKKRLLKRSSAKKTIKRPVKKEGLAQMRRIVYLCGESFGGCLAMHVLTHAPDLFDSLVLVNPASSFRRLPWMQLGQAITKRLPDTVYRYGAMGLVPFLIDPFRVGPRERKALEKAMDAVPPQTAAWRMSLLSDFRVERLPLERMAHPVLLVAGGRDRLLPSKREVSALYHRFPNAQQYLLPKSGHACLLEKDVSLKKIMLQNGFIPER